MNKYLNKLTNILAFVFAALFGNEVFYFAQGNTYFYNISTLFSAFIVLFFCLIDIRKVIHNFLNVGCLLYVFVILIVFSYINSFVFSNSISEFLVTIKGTVVFALECGLTVFAALLLKDKIQQMASGLYFSVIVNFLFSLVVLITYRLSNYLITFYPLFPQIAFYVPNGGEIQLQGFFREPAHLTNFLVISYFFLFNYYKKIISRLLLFVSVFGTLLLAGSGNVIVFVLGYFFVAVLERHRIALEIKAIFHSKLKMTICLIFLALFLGAIIVAFSVPSISKTLILAIKSVNPLDESNAPRLRNNLLGIEVIVAYPFGTGFNMSSIAGARLHPDWTVTAVQNYVLQIADEMTVFGALVYLAIWVVPIIKLCSKKARINQPYLAAALLCTLLLEMINGATYLVHYFVLGVSYCAILPFSKMVSVTYVTIGTNKKRICDVLRSQLFWD